jgi:tetratricopeptide (TPR) repeat protein
MAFCTNCGVPLKEGAKFCGNCGRAIPLAEPVTAEPPQVTAITEPAQVTVTEPVEIPAAVTPAKPGTTETATGKPLSLGLAYVLWFFLGLFGVHQFYLGRRLEGVLRVIINLLIYTIAYWVVNSLFSKYLFLLLMFVPWLFDAFTMKKQRDNPGTAGLLGLFRIPRKPVVAVVAAALAAAVIFIVVPSELPSAYFNSAEAYANKGDYDRAIANYTRAISLRPDYVGTYYSRAMAYSNKGDYDRAIADYTEALRLNPDASWIYSRRGDAYYEKGDYDRAIADYNQSIRLLPDYNYSAYSGRGKAYLEKSEWDQAIIDFEKGSYLGYYLGKAYLEKGDWNQAISNFSTAIERDPDNADAYYGRGYACFYRPDKSQTDNDPGHTPSSLERVYQLFPFLAGDRVLAVDKDQDYDWAIEDFEAAIRIDPNHTPAREMLEIVWRERGY